VVVPSAQAMDAQRALATMTETFLPIWAWVNYPVVLILVMLLTGVLYHFTGNVERRFRLFSAGSIFAVVGIIVGGIAMIIYLTYFASYSSYGAIGTVMAILFVIWL